MTSKFSIDNRELLQRISSGEAVVGIDFGNLIVRELAAFRMAAMDSESWCLPLDYLQGHKDSLEWAAQLAEANHPETGDWLYDDPIELAKAIRKGPDMPPVQPVADSEPDRNPVLAYADSYRDMAKQGVESVPIWSVITELERNIAPIYRHAQQPVVPDAYVRDERGRMMLNGICEPKIGFGAGWNACRAAMLHAQSDDDGEPTDDERIMAIEGIHCCERCGDEGWVVGEMGITRCACGHAGNSPVIPDGWTGNDKANAALMMLDRIETVDPVDDDRIDGIKRIVRELAAAPHDTPALNSVQSVVTVPGKWIPVSERMPEVGVKVLCFPAEDEPIHAVFNGQLWLQDISWSNSDEPIDNVITCNVTHWVPLPASPQEVK